MEIRDGQRIPKTDFSTSVDPVGDMQRELFIQRIMQILEFEFGSEYITQMLREHEYGYSSNHLARTIMALINNL